MNYERDIIIDDSALDVEWLEQPALMLKYSKHEVFLEKERDLKKIELDLKKAELDKDIRTNPDDYDIAKITESVVLNTILMQKDYQQLEKEYLETVYEYNVAKVAVRAFSQRKDALENLVRLHGQQYFAGPKIPRDLSKEKANRETQTKENNEKVKIRKRKQNV